MAQFRDAKYCGILQAFAFAVAATAVASLIGCATVTGLGESSLQKPIPIEPISPRTLAQPNDGISDQVPSKESSSRDRLGIEASRSPVQGKFDLSRAAATPQADPNSTSLNFDLAHDPKPTADEMEIRISDMTLGELCQHRIDSVSQDYRNFYQPANLANLAVGFAVGAGMANTSFDENISNDLFRENFVDIANEDLTQKLHQAKPLGDGYIMFPIIGAAALAQPWLDDSAGLRGLGEWGDRSVRAVLTGGPVVLLMQRVTGASRPNESSSQSHWEPFQDNNGVSGHSFVGAVPFLTLAQMTDRKLLKAVCYVGSVMPAISRINDERHYFSQVFLGWYVAFLASHAINETQTGDPGFRLFPVLSPDGLGLMFDKRF